MEWPDLKHHALNKCKSWQRHNFVHHQTQTRRRRLAILQCFNVTDHLYKSTKKWGAFLRIQPFISCNDTSLQPANWEVLSDRKGPGDYMRKNSAMTRWGGGQKWKQSFWGKCKWKLPSFCHILRLFKLIWHAIHSNDSHICFMTTIQFSKLSRNLSSFSPKYALDTEWRWCGSLVTGAIFSSHPQDSWLPSTVITHCQLSFHTRRLYPLRDKALF